MVRSAGRAPSARVAGASLALVLSLAGCVARAAQPAPPPAMTASSGPAAASPPPSSAPEVAPPATPGGATATATGGVDGGAAEVSVPAAFQPSPAPSSPAEPPEPGAKTAPTAPATARRAVVAKPAAPPARSPAAPPAPIVPTAIERGLALTQTRGCLACHSSDGSERVGPSWRGRWGTQITTEDGRSLRVDAVYVRRSLVDPSADRVAGFDAQMPSYAGILTDEEIEDLIAYIASLR